VEVEVFGFQCGIVRPFHGLTQPSNR
jgi:hypothetical protein